MFRPRHLHENAWEAFLSVIPYRVNTSVSAVWNENILLGNNLCSFVIKIFKTNTVTWDSLCSEQLPRGDWAGEKIIMLLFSLIQP